MRTLDKQTSIRKREVTLEDFILSHIDKGNEHNKLKNKSDWHLYHHYHYQLFKDLIFGKQRCLLSLFLQKQLCAHKLTC